MDQDRFDRFTRRFPCVSASRQQLMRALGGVILGGACGTLAARFGLIEESAAKPKRHRVHKKHQQRANAPLGGLQSEGKKKKKRKKKKRCSELTVPICQACQEPRCNTATGKWECRNSCRAGFTCCNGLCEPNCDNGCTMNDDNACICETPRGAGDVYCAAEHLCAANPCQPGEEFEPSTCECHSPIPQQCGPGWEWCNGACRDAEFGPWTTCGNSCCRADEECCNGRCFRRGYGPLTPCGETCCPDPTHQCCNGKCWPKDQGSWFACGGSVCCRNEYDQCCGNSCCYKEAVCCGGGDRCCPHGYTCEPDGCHRQ